MATADSKPRRRLSVPEPFEPDAAAARAKAKLEHAQALAETFRKFHAGMMRMLSVRTGSSEDAKEILQEAYARVLAVDQPAAASVLPGYLWRVAVNLATDRRRRSALHGRFRLASEPLDERWASSAESAAESRQRLAILERAIGELPPRCLEAFVLYVQDGLTFEKVGHEMGISARMAQKHLARALEYLQWSLDTAEATRSGW